MADAARRLGRPDAAAAIVDDLLGWLGVPNAGQPEPGSEGDDRGTESDPSTPGTSVAPSLPPGQRRTKVKSLKRAPLRLRQLDASRDARLDASLDAAG